MTKRTKKERSKISVPEKHGRFSEKRLNKIAIGILFILPFIFFYRLLSGKVMMYGSDWLLAACPQRMWMSSYIAQHARIPMWYPYIYSGRPSVANFFGDAFYPTALFRLFIPIHIVWTYAFVFHIFLAGLGAYLFLRELKLSVYPSLLAGMVYMFAGDVISTTYAGHDGKLICAALFPFALLFLHKGLKTHRLPYFLFMGSIFGLSLLSGHFQKAYYSLVLSAFYLLCYLIWERKKNKLGGSIKLVLFYGLGILFMVCLVAVQYLPVYGSLPYGARGETRGYEYATSWSMPTAEFLNLLTPHFSGILNNYWGESYFKLHSEYLGILSLLLMGIAVAYKRRDRYVKFFIWLGVVTTIMALGGYTPLYKIPYYLLPGLKKFRCPSQIFYLVSFAVAILAGFGIQSILNKRRKAKDERQKSYTRLAIGLGIVFGIVVIFSLLCSLGKDFMLGSLKSHFQSSLTQQKVNNLYKNYPYFLKGLGIALFLILINSGLILLLAMKRLKAGIWALIALPILIFDVWIIELRFVRTVPVPPKYYARDDVVTFLKNDRTLYRVFPLYYEHTNDGFLGYHSIQSAGGVTANPLARYQKFIGTGGSVMFNPRNLIKYKKFLNLLNIKYIISIQLPEDVSRYDKRTQEMIRNLKDYLKDFKLVYRGKHTIYENEDFLPRAFLVPDFEVYPKEEVLNRMKDFDPRTTVILEESPEVSHPESLINSGTVNIISYDANRIVCEANMIVPGFLVLSENYHPAWKCWVDGKRSKIYCANYTFRAVWLPPGVHKVEFVYDSIYFKLGAIMSSLSILFLIGVIIWHIRLRRIRHV